MSEVKQRPAFRLLDMDKKDSFNRALEVAVVWPAKSGKEGVYSVKVLAPLEVGKYYTMVKPLPPKGEVSLYPSKPAANTEAPTLDDEVPF